MEVKRGNRQWNPLWVAQSHVAYMSEALSTPDKRSRFGTTAAGASAPSDEGTKAAIEVWLKSGSRGGGARRLTRGGAHGQPERGGAGLIRA